MKVPYLWQYSVLCYQSEEAERYWFAFVLYSVRRLSESNMDDSSQGNGQKNHLMSDIEAREAEVCVLISLLIINFWWNFCYNYAGAFLSALSIFSRNFLSS